MRKFTILAALAALCATTAGAALPGVKEAQSKAWYDAIFQGEAPTELPAPAGMEQEPSGALARLVPIAGHFTVSADNVMALKLRSGSGDDLAASLTTMGFAVTSNADLHGGYFLMVNVGATDPVAAAFAFTEYAEVGEVWVKQSLYDAVMSAR